MARIDVFNGDADGICALQQLRLAAPGPTTLVTGVKRDIALVRRVEAGPGDEVAVLDVSLDKNRDALVGLLDRGARVIYFDHHFPGDVPDHPGLEAHIDTTPDVGTCFLVDAYLQGARRAWAVVGTYGDNFDATAAKLAATLGLGDADLQRLRKLGIYINYNGYGAEVEDLHYAPDVLFQRLHPYADPRDFIADDEAYDALEQGYHDDMRRARAVRPEVEDDHAAVYRLPAEPWARRVGGVYANLLAGDAPERAHALLTERPEGGFVVSVRAPLTTRTGADALCRQFPTGGGRQAAAGINALPEDQLEVFVDRFRGAFA